MSEEWEEIDKEFDEEFVEYMGTGITQAIRKHSNHNKIKSFFKERTIPKKDLIKLLERKKRNMPDFWATRKDKNKKNGYNTCLEEVKKIIKELNK